MSERSTALIYIRNVTPWLLSFTLALFARTALAADVTVQVTGAPPEVVEYLTGASLAVETAAQPGAKPQDLLAAARADYARMVGALYELGHYGGVVSIRVDGREAADISPVAGPRTINRIAVVVDPGPTFTFSTARVAPLAPGTDLPENFAPGKRAFAETVAEAAKAGVTRWREIGHAKVDVTDELITADHRTRTLAADIRLAPGPRLTFGNLNVANRGKVRPERIREIAGLPTGKVYSPEALDKSSQRLRDTGAFRSVVLSEAELPGPGNTLDINADLVDAKPRRIGFGAEIASLEGLSLSGFWLHRNLFGGAERLRLEGEVRGVGGDSGGIDYRASARFERPATFTPDTTFYFAVSVEEEDEPLYRERKARIGAGLSHVFSDTLTGAFGTAYQYSEIDDALGSRTIEHLQFPATLTFDNRDDPLDAHSGIYAQADLTPFASINGGGSGARFYGDLRSYVGFGENDRFVFATRTQVGSINGARVTEVPADMLFFSGGAGTVRGQPYQSLSIDLGGGNLLGGRSFLAASAELRARVKDKWSVVGFVDTGFVGLDSWGTKSGAWHSGAGLGGRYHTSIGPIRVDIATPLDDDAGTKFEFYVGIGQAF